MLYSEISEALDKWMESANDSDIGEALGTINDVHLDDLDMEAIDENDDGADGAEANGEDDAPIVRFVNKMLLDAIRMGASDIHFEPYEKTYRVRFRVDGILQEMSKPPANLAPRLAARLKVMARMDISERRVPQDGRVKLKLSKTRLSTFGLIHCRCSLAKKLCCVFSTPAVPRWELMHWAMKRTRKNFIWRRWLAPRA